MTGLTDRQLEVLRYIARQIEDAGYPPTIREIGEALDIRSTNGVNDHLKALERKGFLTRDPVKSRALIPTSRARDALGEAPARAANVIPLARGTPRAGGLAEDVLGGVRRDEGARLHGIAGEIPLALQRLQVIVDAVGGADAEGLADLADRGRVALVLDRALDEGEDLVLPFGELGHEVCTSMAEHRYTGTAFRRQESAPRAAVAA